MTWLEEPACGKYNKTMTSLLSPDPISSPLKRWLLQSACLYGLLLIPTGLLLGTAGGDDAAISRMIMGAWEADFWHFPGLGAKVSSIIGDVLLFICIGLLAWLFYQGYRLLSQQQPEETERSARLVLLGSVLFSLILLAVIPFHSSDLYGYINRGAQQAVYHVNPYVVTVAEIPDWQQDPLFQKHWIHNPSPYGFLFTRLTGELVMFTGGSFFLSFLLFKLLNVAVFGVTTWLIYRFAIRLNLEKPVLAMYLYGWNPLILLHLVANGHNDGLLALFLLLAVYVLQFPQWRVLSLPLLLASIFTKYASVLALPFIVMGWVKQRDWKGLLESGILAGLFLFGLAWPYMADFQNWKHSDMLSNASVSHHSLHAAISDTVYYAGKWFVTDAGAWKESVRQLFKPFFWGGFIVFYAWLLYRFVRERVTTQVLLQVIAVALVGLIVFASSKFHAWYVGMFFPLLLLLEENSPLRRFGVYFAAFQLLAFTPFENLHILNALVMTLLPLYLVYKERQPKLLEQNPVGDGSVV